MADIKIYGAALSTFVRSARMACIEKGVPHDNVMMAPGQTVDGVRHPFGRIPVMVHGDLTLYETLAICNYIDRGFAGPPLRPADPAGRARVDQWGGFVTCYYDVCVTRGLLVPRLVYQPRGKPVDEAAIAANLPKVRDHLAVADAALAQSAFLVGDAISIADFMLVPPISYLRATAEGKEMLPSFPNLGRWYQSIKQRPSFIETIPPRG
jgi:glutathione S-transferase